MKFIDCKLIQNSDSRKKGKYHLTIEINDYDIEMFEEFGKYPTAQAFHYDNPYSDLKEYSRMNKYLSNIFHKVFQRIWRKFD